MILNSWYSLIPRIVCIVKAGEPKRVSNGNYQDSRTDMVDNLVSAHVSESVDDSVGVGTDGLSGISAVVGASRKSSNGSLQANSVFGVAADGFLLVGNNVSGTTAANGVHWSNGIASQLVALEFFVEGEHGTFGSGVSVTDTSTTTVEWAGLWLDVVSKGLWSSDLSLGELAIVAGAANAGVVEGGLWSWFVGSEAHCD